MIKGLKILLISPEEWGDNFVSKHLYAKYLSKNNKVFFLNPVSASSFKPFGETKITTKKLSNNLEIISYKNLLPKLNALPKFIQSKLYKKQAQQIQRVLDITEFDIIWSFDPYRFWDLKWFKADKYIYHTVDVHFSKCFEGDIAKSADLVLLSSELLRENLTPYNDNIHYIGHAADIDAFKKQKPHKFEDPKNNRVIAGLVGNFNNNVDYDLMEDIVKQNNHIDFYFIGPYKSNNLGNTSELVIKKVDDLKKYSNVTFIGSVPSDEIMQWLLAFDINMVLYKEEKRDIIINPHKMMGYFYSGNITICSWFKEYDEADDRLLIMTSRNKEIPQKVKEVSENLNYWNDKELMKMRRDFALTNSYDQKINAISDFF